MIGVLMEVIYVSLKWYTVKEAHDLGLAIDPTTHAQPKLSNQMGIDATRNLAQERSRRYLEGETGQGAHNYSKNGLTCDTIILLCLIYQHVTVFNHYTKKILIMKSLFYSVTNSRLQVQVSLCFLNDRQDTKKSPQVLTRFAVATAQTIQSLSVRGWTRCKLREGVKAFIRHVRTTESNPIPWVRWFLPSCLPKFCCWCCAVAGLGRLAGGGVFLRE